MCFNCFKFNTPLSPIQAVQKPCIGLTNLFHSIVLGILQCQNDAKAGHENQESLQLWGPLLEALRISALDVLQYHLLTNYDYKWHIMAVLPWNPEELHEGKSSVTRLAPEAVRAPLARRILILVVDYRT